MRLRVAVVAVIAALVPGLANAGCMAPGDGLGFSDFDLQRLAGLEASREKGLHAASEAPQADADIAIGLFTQGMDSPDPNKLAGTYQCRTIKYGGQFGALTIYNWFKCRITADGDTFELVKTTGSQNFSGTLFPSEDAYIFQGAGHYDDEQPRAYGEDPERDLAGCLWQLPGSPVHFILELPSPRLESDHDVIEFRRG